MRYRPKYNRLKWYERLILKATHRLWNRRIFSILSHQYNEYMINSHQLHVLLSRFDPTQDHDVYT